MERGLFDVVERDVGSIRLPKWGRVVPAEGAVPWLVVDPDGVPIEPVRRFLVDFVARDNRRGSVRSYAYSLLRWCWLQAVEVAWDQATPAEVRDLVLWLRGAGEQTTAICTHGLDGDGRDGQPGDPQAIPRRPVQADHGTALERGAAHVL